tara:strand:- start:70 stop:564 length:495 start_codon:yes stop_codon:yes gene_type:complete
MVRKISIIILSTFLAGCLDPAELTTSSGKTYWISKSRAEKMHGKMVDAVNFLRIENSLREIVIHESLNLAASAHSQDMYQQDRAWHFGADGSSPIERIAKFGFTGELIGENIAETYEDDVSTLNAWMDQENTRSIILDKDANYMGLGWHQAEDGKIWWTQIFGK